jgi:hypothetical protein
MWHEICPVVIVTQRRWPMRPTELLQEKVSHFPPGTSKWNKIEHQLFSFISKNWRCKPLLSLAVIVSLIGATPTQTGLKVKYILDRNEYRKGVKVSDDSLAKVNLTRDPFHGEWNYEIRPTRS